jgi:hypothetical protein
MQRAGVDDAEKLGESLGGEPTARELSPDPESTLATTESRSSS